MLRQIKSAVYLHSGTAMHACVCLQETTRVRVFSNEVFISSEWLGTAPQHLWSINISVEGGQDHEHHDKIKVFVHLLHLQL